MVAPYGLNSLPLRGGGQFALILPQAEPAEPPRPAAPEAPGFLARLGKEPLIVVELDPYLIGKFELTQDQLAASLFPLGELSKEEVRDLARQAGLMVAEKPDGITVAEIREAWGTSGKDARPLLARVDDGIILGRTR